MPKCTLYCPLVHGYHRSWEKGCQGSTLAPRNLSPICSRQLLLPLSPLEYGSVCWAIQVYTRWPRWPWRTPSLCFSTLRWCLGTLHAISPYGRKLRSAACAVTSFEVNPGAGTRARLWCHTERRKRRVFQGKVLWATRGVCSWRVSAHGCRRYHPAERFPQLTTSLHWITLRSLTNWGRPNLPTGASDQAG